MAKQIINYELFTEQKEKLERIHKRQRQRKIRRRVALVVILACVLIAYLVIENSRSGYYEYDRKTNTEDNTGVHYQPFAGGLLKYSTNGIEYQKQFGTSTWNKALSLSKPVLKTSNKYAILGDQEGNVLYLFDQTGQIRKVTLQYPILHIDVSDTGIMVVTLQGDDRNFVQVYDKKGNLVADMRASIDETGYPVTAAISPNGGQLAVSYLAIDGMKTKSTVTFYDLAKQLQTDDVTLKGGFEYHNTMIPKLSFLSNDKVLAVGHDKIHYYKIDNQPEEVKTIKVPSEIQSIFENNKYLGLVMDNSANAKEGRYRICLYNHNGRKSLDTKIDMQVDDVSIWDNQIIAVKNNIVTILKSNGRLIYQGELEGNKIEAVLPTRGFRKYQVIFVDKTVRMKLRFWDKN